MRTSENAKRFLTSKRKRYILIAIIGISILLILSTLALFLIDRSNTLRYRTENYDKLEQNLVNFGKILEHSEGFVDNMKTSEIVLPYMESRTQEEIHSVLNIEKSEDGLYIITDRVDDGSPFLMDSQEHKMYNRMQSLLMGNPSYSDFVLYMPSNEVYLTIVAGGATCAACFSREEFQRVICMEGKPEEANDGMLFAAKPTVYSQSELFIVRELPSGALLFCGVDNAQWKEALFAQSVGRSYTIKQMILNLPNGGRISLNGGTGEATIFEDMAEQQQTMVHIGEQTIMRHVSESPAYELITILEETGVTSVVESDSFRLFLIVNVLWLVVVIIICINLFIRVSKPLRKLSDAVGVENVEESMTDEIERIRSAIENYNLQLIDKQMTIKGQAMQLRQAYLRQLILDQNSSMSNEQMEKLGLTDMLRCYVVITIYPDDGRWSHEDGSTQASSYRQHITALSVMESLKLLMQNDEAEFVTCQACLMAIVPVEGQEQKTEIYRKMESSIMEVSHQLQKRFQFGVSKAHCGADKLCHAYHEAMRQAAIVEEQISGRSDDVSLSTQLKQNMHMADLIYVEKYNGAFACLKDMIHTLSQQKSVRLRNQQISCLLSLTLCMLLETNEVNATIIEQMDVDLNDLIRLNTEEEIVENWGNIFTQLENHKDARLRGSYSEQFASIYQYMHAHFRDPELSLSFLADEFNMSMSTLSREFQKNLGQGFLESIHGIRIEAAKYEIEHTNAPLSDIAISVGYTNTLTMTRAFKKYLGCTPSVFRKKGNDVAP